MMKVKVFEVSVESAKAEKDQERLNKFLLDVSVIKTSTQFINGAFNCWSVMIFYEEVEHIAKTKSKDETPIVKLDPVILNESAQKLLELLKQWRQKKAAELSLPVFMVCSNKELETVALTLPLKIEDLSHIKGFGDQKIAKFGKEIIKVVKGLAK